MKQNPSRRPYKPVKQHESRSPWSVIMLIAWVLIFSWLGFLIYCWRSGFIHLQKASRVADHVDQQPVNLRAENGKKEGHTEKAVEAKNPAGSSPWSKQDVHVIFSTDCNPFQDWQTLLVFHSASVVGQRGPITRIASGCDDSKKVELVSLYKKLWPHYHVHFTPDFKRDEKTNKKYDFYNKPYGLKHWLENADPPLDKDVVIALIDPDMIFMRPLTAEVASMNNNLVTGAWKKEEIFERIEKGKPAAQTYGLGAPWVNDNHAKFNRKKICGEGSPCLEVPNEKIGNKYYSVGPPYIAQKEDLERIAASWTTFVPRVYEGYPFLLAEMYAYSMAAAHENLPHLRMDQWMVSNTLCDDEGWPWVDSLDDVCVPPNEKGIYYPDLPLPTFLHYCQTYSSGDIFFSKRRLSKEMFSCDHPLLVEPSSDYAEATYQISMNKGGKKIDMKNRIQAKRHAFMLCIIHRSLNAALTDYKDRMCPPENVTNYEKIMNVATWKEP